MNHYFDKNLKGKYCDLPFDTAAIQKDGTEYNIYTCWCAGWTQTPLANLKVSSISQAWQTATAKDIRNSVLDGKYYYCDYTGCGNIHNLPDMPEQGIKLTTKLPTQLAIRIDESCNLACPSCRNEVYSDKASYSENVQILDKIVEEYQDFDQQVLVMLDASGEFLASKAYRDTLFSERFPRCFKYQLMSNGVLLTQFKGLLDRIKHNIDSISITFDASTADVYAKTRIGGDWQRLLDGIELLKHMNIPFFAGFVIQQDNQHQILDFYELAKELGARRIIFSSIERFPHMSDEWYKKNKISTLAQNSSTLDQIKTLFELKSQDSNLELYGPLNQYNPNQIIPILNVEK